jgi:hypothetical protein
MTNVTIPLTREQRRMVIEFYATQCAAEMPSDEMPKAEFYQDLHREEYRLRAMKGIEKVIPEVYWTDLIEELLEYQSFDRDPAGWLEENGYSGNESVHATRNVFNNNISYHIDNAARY